MKKRRELQWNFLIKTILSKNESKYANLNKNKEGVLYKINTIRNVENS